MPVIETLQRFIAQSPEWLNPLVAFLSDPATLYQLAIIAALIFPALFIARIVEPKLEDRARQIKGMPGLLRIVVAFLRRSKWLFFAALLAIANVTAEIAGWPEHTTLLRSAMVLAASWLVINAISHVIRSKAIRSLFAWLAWIYVSALILGVVDDVVAILDAPGFTLGDVRVSPLLVLRFAVLAGILVWAASSLGNFFDRRIQNVDELTPSLRVLLGKVTRISLFFVAALLVLQAFNINLTALTVLSGAVGVGPVHQAGGHNHARRNLRLDPGTSGALRLRRHPRRPRVPDSERGLHYDPGRQLVVLRPLRAAGRRFRRLLRL